MKYYSIEIISLSSPNLILSFEFCIWWSLKIELFLLIIFGISDYNFEIGECRGK